MTLCPKCQAAILTKEQYENNLPCDECQGNHDKMNKDKQEFNG